MSASGPQVSRDIPILFSGPMVSALLDGRKTQTRRLIKQPRHKVPSDATARWTFGYKPTKADPPWMELSTPLKFGNQIHHIFRVPARVGDRLWVKETWAPLSDLTHNDPGTAALAENGFYRADGGTVDGEIGKWHPSIYMPRRASRLTLTVTDVRVQRLQDISEADAVAEGAREYPCEGPHRGPDATYWTMAEPDSPLPVKRLDPVRAFKAFFEELHGEEIWQANPWVCAISFECRKGNIDDSQV